MTEPTHEQLLSRWKRDSARRAVRRAVRAGRLVIPKRCHYCAQVAPLQGHHRSGYDTAAILDVEFVCRRCHDDIHAGRPLPESPLVAAERVRALMLKSDSIWWREPSPATAPVRPTPLRAQTAEGAPR